MNPSEKLIEEFSSMSSAFESEVYAERQRLPGVAINVATLLKLAVWNTPDCPPASLTVEYRADVDTRTWWTFRWGDQFAAAKDLEVCLFQAAVMMRKNDKRAQRYAGIQAEGEAK